MNESKETKVETTFAYPVSAENDTLEGKVMKFAVLADSGDELAAFYYGEMLLKGVWDEDRMMRDQLAGKLIPPPPSSSNTSDAYLVLPRDPVRAVEFLRRAAEYRDFLHEVKRARGLIKHLQLNNLAGFVEVYDKFECADGDVLCSSEQEFLCKFARNSLRAGSNRFVPVRDSRPQLRPKSVLFKDMAVRIRNRCLIQCLISTALFSLPCLAEYPNMFVLLFQSQLLNLFLYVLPLLIFAGIAQMFGVRRWAPLCSCDKIHNAYDVVIGDNPSVFETRKNPFRATPVLVRNSHRIRQFLFWSYFIFALIILAFRFFGSRLLVDFLKFYNLNTNWEMILPVLLLVMSSIIIFYDKKPQNFIKDVRHQGANINYSNNGHVAIFVFIFIMIFFFDDRDCRIEDENVKEMKNLEARKESILRKFKKMNLKEEEA